jgi:2-polyprenyl-6-methoxyphenol hydroxylase-like FAD-dependent oxidoreductase
MERRLDIAVVGAGVAGLAAGMRLAAAGHRVVLFERFPESRPLGSGLMLQPTGLAALARLGLRAEIEALGARIDRLHGVTDRGRLVFDLGYDGLAPGLHAVAVHRAALHGVLWRGFVHSGAGLETGRAIAGLEALADGRAALRDAAGRATPGFDLVLDASGATSGFRAGAGQDRARPFAYGAVWASVPDTGLAPGRLAQRYVAARIMLGWLPVGRAAAGGPPLAAFFWSLRPDGHAAWAAGFPAWQERVARLWPEMAPMVAGLPGPEALTLARYWHFTARRPFRGPLALIGDAAHATSPQLGQGANNALLDALALADALEEAPDIGAALAAYAAARRAHVRFYQLASALMTPFFQSDSRALSLLRDLAFDRMKLLPPLRREMLRTLAGLKTGVFGHQSPERLADPFGRDG